jgi:hypothetical protein
VPFPYDLTMWYRIFSGTADEPDPVAMVEHLHDLGHRVAPHFTGDDLGWTSARLEQPDGPPLVVSRYLTKADDLRHDLNAHAAELETMDDPASTTLMERVIQTQQMFTIEGSCDLCEALAKWLAARTGGLMQIDGRGWHDAEGNVLLKQD